MANRQMLTSATAGVVTGDDYMDNVAGHLTRLYDAAAFPLTGIGGTGNAVTANLDPVLTAGLVTGMKFTLTWATANSAGVTLSINGGAAVPVLGATGAALTTGALIVGGRSILEYVGSAFVVLSGAGSSADVAVLPQFTLLTVSGTWTKPTGYPDDHRVMIEAVGGGGGGLPTSGGGGGGACLRRWLRMSQIPASVNYLIGAGGTVGANGGNTTFGALVTGFGGGAASGTQGGTGAGAVQSGSAGGYLGGGVGGIDSAGANATTEGGGGGGGGAGFPPKAGGRAIYGGGGGAGGPSGAAGGISLFGGSGGAIGVAGQAPGGAGGAGAVGARGEIRIWL